MVYRTVKDWNLRGKRIKTGQKHSARTSTGECLFSSNQVVSSDAHRLRSIIGTVNYYEMFPVWQCSRKHS